MNSLSFQSAENRQGILDYISKIDDIAGIEVLSHDIDENGDSFKLKIYISNGDIIEAEYTPAGSALILLNDEPVYNESNPPIDYVSSFLGIIPSIYKDYISSNGDSDVNESMQSDSTTYTV